MRDPRQGDQFCPATRALIDMRFDATTLLRSDIVVQIACGLGVGQVLRRVEVGGGAARISHAYLSSHRSTHKHG
jgi:hypothetical protein